MNGREVVMMISGAPSHGAGAASPVDLRQLSGNINNNDVGSSVQDEQVRVQTQKYTELFPFVRNKAAYAAVRRLLDPTEPVPARAPRASHRCTRAG